MYRHPHLLIAEKLLASSSSPSSSSSLSNDLDGVPFPEPMAYYPILQASYDDAMHSLLTLLISKRLALYALATASTAYAGWRAYATGVRSMRRGVYGGPGDALDELNREVLSGEGRRIRRRPRRPRRGTDAPIDKVGAVDVLDSNDVGGDGGDIAGEDGGPFASLVDDGPTSSEDAGTLLALTLLLVLGATLALSYVAIGPGPIDASSTGAGTVDAIGDAIARLGPIFSTFPGATICLLFLATEFRWAIPDDDDILIVRDAPPVEANATTTTAIATTSLPTTADATARRRHPILRAGNALALAYVIGAYFAGVHPTIDVGPARLDLWPLQNGANIALVATVARALSPFLLATTTTFDVGEENDPNRGARSGRTGDLRFMVDNKASKLFCAMSAPGGATSKTSQSIMLHGELQSINSKLKLSTTIEVSAPGGACSHINADSFRVI